jgi:flagellar biogenesis protein FliO
MPTLSQSLAVFLVLALLCGLLWLARNKGLAAFSTRWARSGSGRAQRQMRVIERLPLSGQHSLHLVSCAGRLILVAASPAGCSSVANFPENFSEFAETVRAAGGGR